MTQPDLPTPTPDTWRSPIQQVRARRRPGWARASVAVALQAASNGHGPTAVAINYLRPASLGDTVLAEALEEHRGGRLALHRIEVRRVSYGSVVALATGQVAITRS